MNVNEYLKQVANIVDSDIPDDNGKIYVSKFNGSYITRVGLEKEIQFLANRGITENLEHGVGFSPSENKWYGWSHRAIYGFTIGSECKKGDCHYVPDTIENQIEDAMRFWSEPPRKNAVCKGTETDEDGEKYLVIEWEYNETVPNKKLRGKTGGTNHLIGKLGRGEWKAETMEDAEQMARDFNEGVS